ncbi:SDR family oxidoreductase [Niveispirillum sp. KHB5.9]|uniref:SDR family oxidoreductase n=1 Tax=Niveispirillum sp. KHB5.9 TaxID=3400269 RepID=UPI003A85B122
MTDVQGRTAFITGGGNGIGLGIARSFARAGARLALVDLDGDALASAKAELQDITPVETFQLDVRDRDAYAAAADAAERALGPVSLLFNNAGVAGAFPAEKLTYELWDWSIGINLYGVINGIQSFLPRMAARGGGGHIVNTASGAGLAATSSGVLYCTAKFGVVGLSEALNVELAPAGIGVSVLCPGPVATGIIQRSADAAPLARIALSQEQESRRAERIAVMNAALKQAVSADKVGDMVLKAVQDNGLYIHVDRVMEERIIARTRALLAAMPD